ncbi:MAG: hypothetical protein AAGC88_06300 [Bacteroidota bacterium]
MRSLLLTLVVSAVLFGCGSGNELGVQLMSGDGQDLGRFTKGEEIVISGSIARATDSTRLLFAINLSPLRLIVTPETEGSETRKDFTIEIPGEDPFLFEGGNELVIMRLDGKQQAEHSMSFEIE